MCVEGRLPQKRATTITASQSVLMRHFLVFFSVKLIRVNSWTLAAQKRSFPVHFDQVVPHLFAAEKNRTTRYTGVLLPAVSEMYIEIIRANELFAAIRALAGRSRSVYPWSSFITFFPIYFTL